MNYLLFSLATVALMFSLFVKAPRFDQLTIDEKMQYLFANYGLILENHSDTLLSLTVHEGKIFTGSKDHTIRVWDQLTGEQIYILYGHTAPVCQLDVLPNQSILVSASRDGIVKYWDLNKYIPIKSIKAHNDWITTMQIQHPNTLYTISNDGILNIWDLNTLTNKHSIDLSQRYIFSSRLSSDYKSLVFASNNKNLTFWDLEGQKMIKNFVAHNSQTVYSGFCCKDQKVISAGKDDEMKIWKFPNGELVGKLQDSHKMRSVKVVGDSVIGINRDEYLLVWELGSEEVIKRLCLENYGDRLSKFFVQANTNFLLVYGERLVYKLDLTTMTLEKALKDMPVLINVEINHDQGVILGKSEDSKVLIWNLATGELIDSINSEASAKEFDDKYKGVLNLYQSNS